MPRKSYKIQEALQQRKQNEAAALDNLRVEETAYQCYFQPDSLPSPMESGVICILPLAKLSVYPNHETYFPLYTGERLDDMVESICLLSQRSPETQCHIYVLPERDAGDFFFMRADNYPFSR